MKKWMAVRVYSIVFMLMILGNGVPGSDPKAREESPRVDFSYAFSYPHRMTVARPENSHKTLLDLEPGALRVAWSFDNLLRYPAGAFVTPRADWAVKITPEVDGQPFAHSSWTRAEGWLPILENRYTKGNVTLLLEAAGGVKATLVRLTMTNAGTTDRIFRIPGKSLRGFFGYNPGYVDPARDRDCLLAGWGDRADRIIVLAPDADHYTIGTAVMLCPEWKVRAGETRIGWILFPYQGYAADLAVLRKHDWPGEFDAAKKEWRTLLERSVRVTIPDEGVQAGFYAGLGDLFIMREPVEGGRVAGIPGTEGYRAAGTVEGAIVAIALDQVGLSREASEGFQVCMEMQGEDGDWNDPNAWGHLMWGVAGFKSWAAMEHYRLTGDREYLAAIYPRMLASSRWQEKQRARMRVLANGMRPVTYGLMPRGMGDCGLMDGEDLYGIFLPHNIWAVYADRVAMETAVILGKTSEAEEMSRIYQAGRKDLLQALDRGAIQEDGYRWIPGVAGKTTGSRWGALNALFPCELLDADHELILGTLRHIRSNISPGGIPMNTGWLKDGMWVAIALDNLAEVHLVRDEGDQAADLLYATLNHATPLYTWCEERGPEPMAKKTTGDRQHLWTPVAVVREIRDSLVLEQGSVLYLGRGLHRSWLGSGKPVGIADAPTHFGKVSYQMRYEATGKRVSGKVTFPAENRGMSSAVLSLRLPKGLRISAIDKASRAELSSDGGSLRWKEPRGTYTFQATIQEGELNP